MTLKQWFDSLSEPAQAWIESKCSAWFDKNQADYYKKPSKAGEDKDALKALLRNEEDLDKYSSYSSEKGLSKRYVNLLRYLHNTYPDLVSESDLDKYIWQILECGCYDSDTWLNLSDAKREAGFKRCFQKWSKMSLEHYLYLIKDYSNIEIDWEEVETPALTQEVVEILGHKAAINLVYQIGNYNISKMIKTDQPNDLFDEIFFCKDSKLTQRNKLEILSRVYADSSYLPTEETTRDFFKRIVAVDHAYLRFIYDIISRYPALAMKLYCEKKPDSELTGNETASETFRYPKELRKVFVIAHACALKRVSKVKSGICKEIAPLLKIYGYNWNEIYDAMYPEDPKLN